MAIGDTVTYLGKQCEVVIIDAGGVHIVDADGNGYAVLQTILEEENP